MKKQKYHRVLSEIFHTALLFLICYLSFYLLTTYIAKPIRVNGSSMYPTLRDGEFGISNVLDKSVNGVSRFDIVIVKSPLKEKEQWVKRIIALPGETISYQGDKLYINGGFVSEDFLDSFYVEQTKNEYHRNRFTDDFGPVELGEDEYFLMGDNRRVSEDSRYIGTFHDDMIISKDAFILIH